MTATTSRLASPAAPSNFRLRMLGLAAVFMFGCCYSLLDHGISGLPESATNSYLWAILAVMALIASNAMTANQFLFSCSFWVTVEFLFYIVLKALAVSGDLDAASFHKALLASLLFLAGYLLGQMVWPMQSLLRPQPYARLAASPRLYRWLVFTFISFKLLNLFLLVALGGGETALEVSQETQNQGASYLFKLPTLALASYFLLLLFAYKHGHFRRTAFAMTAWILFEGVLGAARYSMVTTVLINLLLYHLYVRPLRITYLLIVSPFLVFVITFFGFVRNIELANAAVYASALSTFLEERELMFKLFMSRLDMLPQMTEAFRLDALHLLKNEGGLSYIYSFVHAVPRNFWPNKPPLTAAYVTEQVNPGAFADGVNIFPSIMLEAYINLLWIGPILIGIFIAKLSSLYDRALFTGSLRTQAMALIAFTFPMGLINEGIHSNIFATLLYLGGIYIAWLSLTRFIVGKTGAKRLAMP